MNKKPVNKKKETQLNVHEDTTLMFFLLSKMGGMTRTSVKQLLGHRQVQVDGSIETRFDRPLHEGMKVTILSGQASRELVHPKLKVVYEDDDLIVVEKKVGLLTVPTFPGSTETTVFSILKHYVRQANPRAGVYVVHRLDRETSGLLVFAKSQELQHYMRDYWKELVTRRTYVAVAEGILPQKEGKITTWLTEDPKSTVVYSSPVDDGGKIAITNYKVVKEFVPEIDETSSVKASANAGYSLVELNLETGRTNQIRVHLASIGHPVVGDRKYGHGNASSPLDRLALHARVLEFINPVTEKPLHFEIPTPKDFLKLLK